MSMRADAASSSDAHPSKTVSIGSLPEIATNACDETLIYNAICRIVRHYQPAAVCLVLEAETDLQIKAAYGMPRRRLPCNSITRHVSGRPLPIMIGDARADHRFVDDCLVTEPPYVRFFVGAPIIMAASDTCVGSLCLLGTTPREECTLEDCEVLLDAAQTIAAHFDELSSAMSPRVSRRQVATLDSLPSVPELGRPDECDSDSQDEGPPYDSGVATHPSLTSPRHDSPSRR